MNPRVIRILVWIGAFCLFFALVNWAVTYRVVSIADPDAMLRKLLADRRLVLSVPYKIVNSLERHPSLLRGGRFRRYFRLQLQGGDGDKIVHDKVFREMVVITHTDKLLGVDDQPDWWQAENGAIYSGVVTSKDTREAIDFDIILGATNDWVFINSVTLR